MIDVSRTSYTGIRPRRLTLLTMLGLLACGNERSPPPQPQPSAPAIDVSVDGGPARRVSVTAPSALAALVPEPPISRWLEVVAHAGTRALELATPATTYADAELRVFAARGKVAIGVFPHVATDLPPEVAALARHPLVELVGVTAIEIYTRRPELPRLDIVVDGETTQLTSDQLRGLRSISAGKVRAHGWPLAEVIALATPARELHAVRLEGAQPIDLSPQDLHAADKALLLKPNQRGEYVFRVWEPGAKYPTREARGVTKIVVERARGFRP